MQIGELSQRTGISVRMLRFYEKEGVLVPGRRQSGYRDYNAADERIARRIRLLSDTGLKLSTIKILLPCVRNDAPEFELCDEVRTTLKHEIAGIDSQIARLRTSRRILVGYLGEHAMR